MNAVFPKKCIFVQMQLVRGIYSFFVQLTWYFLHIIAKFNPKIERFVSGRKKTFVKLENQLSGSDRVIWMHVASLGEYEQGLPVLERLKSDHPGYKIVLTFFSPSGFEVKKDKTPADLVVYLPLDTQKNARLFLDKIHPKMAIFIKYEVWPNFLFELKKRKTPTLLVSGIFSKRQVYFKWYGHFMKSALRNFSHFFVQEENSKNLLKSIGFTNATVSGDTRFDRVNQILSGQNSLEFMDDFKRGSTCVVAGSTWPEDETVLIDFINQPNENLKFVIAPHNIKSAHIGELRSSITKKTLLFSEIEKHIISDFEVLIVDTVGLLTKIYSYANVAYVGGGFATGLHNTLEPAVYGIPVIIGPHYKGFNEAEQMVNRKGVLVIKDKAEFNQVMTQILEDPQFSETTGKNNSIYIEENIGATETVMQHIKTLL